MKTTLMIFAVWLISLVVSAQDVIENVVKPRFSDYGVTVTAEGLTGRQGSVVVLAGIENPSRHRKDVALKSSLYDSYGRLVAQGTTNVTIRASRRVKAGQRVQLDAPLLWTVKDPALYTLRVELVDPEDKNDVPATRQMTIGLNRIAMAGSGHMTVNGELMPLRGLRADRSISPENFRRLLRVMQKGGMNAVEVIGAGEQLASIADREGIVLIDTAATDARHPAALRVAEPLNLPAEALVDRAGFPTQRFYELCREYGGNSNFGRTTPHGGKRATALRVLAEDKQISVSDFRPAYVAVEAVDEAGRLCMDDARTVEVSVNGQKRQIALVDGRALILVTGRRRRGPVKVEASGAGLASGSDTVMVK